MQSQISELQTSANAATTPFLSPPHENPLNESDAVGLREAWLEHQVNPLGRIQSRGVPYSALNE